MKKSEKTKRIIAGVFSAMLAFNCLSAGGVKTFAADADFAEERTAEEIIKELEEKGMHGDINADGTINVLDVIRYKQVFLAKETVADEQLYHADANGDGVINSADFIAVIKDILGESVIWSYQRMPKMDGSTSAIPLEAGFKSKMLGINYNDAKKIVKHHKTHESFSMLLSGENDMIFTVPISEEQKKAAEEAGRELTFVPVAKEGFVFVVNRNNPVESLTMDQIRDIYSGKITNWKEVGGNDEKIIPYQRNKDSGSQNYMTEFMEGYDLMDPPKDYVLVSMGGLMDGLAVYDNAENAIGYSVYSYAAQIYENSSDVKFIAVDGVKPTRETMADGTYPLLSSTYIVYTDKATQSTRSFAKWAVSDEGQRCVLESGYVPVNDMEYPESYLPYNETGTGKEKPVDYKPDRNYSGFEERLSSVYDNRRDLIDFLKDKEFQSEINREIEKVYSEAGNADVQADVTIINGYMNICFTAVKNRYMLSHGYQHETYSFYKNLNYDLKNKKKIENFSDLFYSGEEYTEDINKVLTHDISIHSSYLQKSDFIGLLGKVDSFSLNKVFFSEDDPYFTDATDVTFRDDMLFDKMVIGEYCDNQQFLDITETPYERKHNEWIFETVLGEDGEYHDTVAGSRFHTADEVAKLNEVYGKVFEDALKRRDEECKNLYNENYTPRVIISYYPSTELGLNVLYVDYGKIDGPSTTLNMYDPETGERIYLSDIFGKNFAIPDDERSYPYEIDMYNGELVNLLKDEKVSFDPADVNTKYIIPEDEKVTVYEMEEPAAGIVSGYNEYTDNTYGYASSYILEGGPKKTQWHIEGNWNIVAKKKCFSHGTFWYECWDADDGDYYGWIKSYDLDFK
ncbi:MAG: substrate-binding domain-containing protein [Oscillospiraceae bacterium]|nr:substrate-binding domain-containing protein [Oscillospiraceae bacterium]